MVFNQLKRRSDVISWKHVRESQLRFKILWDGVVEKQPEGRQRVLKRTGTFCKICWRVVLWAKIVVIAVELLQISS